MAGKGTILAVDDDDRNLRVLEAMLTPLGYDMVKARSGEECLQRVREVSPDVILLDVMMPGLDGYEVARLLKGDPETNTIPVVMVTALSQVEDRVKALEAGADDFLTKPVEKSELRARVQSLVKVKAYHDHMRNYQQRLEADVTERTKQLADALEQIEAASLDTIHRLARAAEYKDPHTGSHITRLGHYAVMVAREMDLGQTALETLRYAAPMHDIGKIGIPDEILLKPGPLTEAEREIMKKHTLIGASILEGATSRFVVMGRTIALTHHERWDGKGYPNGLKGIDIPLVGRIVAIADVFDALASKRPYKEALPLEESFATVKECRETYFDPDVVDAFFAAQEEICAIRRHYVE